MCHSETPPKKEAHMHLVPPLPTDHTTTEKKNTYPPVTSVIITPPLPLVLCIHTPTRTVLPTPPHHPRTHPSTVVVVVPPETAVHFQPGGVQVRGGGRVQLIVMITTGVRTDLLLDKMLVVRVLFTCVYVCMSCVRCVATEMFC